MFLRGRHVDLADFDGARSLDLVIVRGPTRTVSIHRGRGDGTFEAGVDIDVGGDAKTAMAATSTAMGAWTSR